MQTLQLFTVIKKRVFTNVIKMPSWKAWLQIPSGLIKMDLSASAFSGNCLVKIENVA
jgi:hypothetical protein